MNFWNRSGCPRMGRWWRTRLRRHTDNPSSSRNILHHKREMVNQQFPLEHNSNITRITDNSLVLEHPQVQELPQPADLVLKRERQIEYSHVSVEAGGSNTP